MDQSSLLHLAPYYTYLEFIKECKLKTYNQDLVLHKHHIIPRHLGGSNSISNIIILSVEDHIESHILLSQCFDIGSYERIANLRSARVLNKKSIKNQIILDEISKTYSGENNPFYGKTHTDETKEILRNKAKAQLSDVSYEERYGINHKEEKEKRSNGMKSYWDNLSEEERKKRSDNQSKSLIGKNTGSANGFSRPLLVDGVRYESTTEAVKALGYTYVQKLYKNHTIIKLEKHEKKSDKVHS